MLQLKNATPFASNIALYPNEKGIDTLYTMVKASFKLDSAWVLADEQLPPQAEDEYWGKPGESSLKYASDYHTGKAATDIVVVGEALAPDGQAVSQLDVQLAVGKIDKTIRVFGDRIWSDGRVSAAKPFTAMPIVYERAFGGQHQTDSDKIFAEEKNPIGCGFKGKQSTSNFEGTLLPNVEDPDNLIQRIGDSPEPAGFGYCAPNWLPRRQYAGTYDDSWQKKRAPYLPQDFDNRFLNAAHPDLIYPGFLKGGEAFIVRNMNLEGDFQAIVPQVGLSCQVKLGGRSHQSEVKLETLILEPNQKQLSMVWRAAFECDKKALQVKEIELKLAR